MALITSSWSSTSLVTRHSDDDDDDDEACKLCGVDAAAALHESLQTLDAVVRA